MKKCKKCIVSAFLVVILTFSTVVPAHAITAEVAVGLASLAVEAGGYLASCIQQYLSANNSSERTQAINNLKLCWRVYDNIDSWLEVSADDLYSTCLGLNQSGFPCSVVQLSNGYYVIKGNDYIYLPDILPSRTYSISGLYFMSSKADIYEKGLEAKKFFLKIWNAPCEKIAIENPTPSRIYELPEKSQVIQPWQFGHSFTKRTQLWLKGLKPLQPTDIVEPERTWCPSGSYSGKHNNKHRGMFTADRAKNRSKTFPGIAYAMAEQWS